jgi:hypothetical protein
MNKINKLNLESEIGDVVSIYAFIYSLVHWPTA